MAGEAPKERTAFLYPDQFRFPFDLSCKEIALQLKRRGWGVPDIKVEFRFFGDRLQFYSPKKIYGEDFLIEFGMREGMVDDSFRGFQKIIIPRQAVKVYDDGSVPEYFLYVGKDWKADAEWFMRGSFSKSRFNKEPRRYLKYVGGWAKPSELGLDYSGSVLPPPYLVHASEGGDEYSPEPFIDRDPNVAWSLFAPDEHLREELKKTPGPQRVAPGRINDAPDYLLTSKVLEYFNSWLGSSILRSIIYPSSSRTAH